MAWILWGLSPFSRTQVFSPFWIFFFCPLFFAPFFLLYQKTPLPSCRNLQNKCVKTQSVAVKNDSRLWLKGLEAYPLSTKDYNYDHNNNFDHLATKMIPYWTTYSSVTNLKYQNFSNLNVDTALKWVFISWQRMYCCFCWWCSEQQRRVSAPSNLVNPEQAEDASSLTESQRLRPTSVPSSTGPQDAGLGLSPRDTPSTSPLPRTSPPPLPTSSPPGGLPHEDQKRRSPGLLPQPDEEVPLSQHDDLPSPGLTSPPVIEHITIPKTVTGLGISVAGGINKPEGPNVYVENIVEGGDAQKVKTLAKLSSNTQTVLIFFLSKKKK